MQPFNETTCVLACSGPSLNKVDPFSLGLPVCVVSTAIRSIPNPHYWFLADPLNDMHGKEGEAAWSNPNITKVIPETKVNAVLKGRKPYILAPYQSSNKASYDMETKLFMPGFDIVRGPHKTITFAIQWLHINGIKNIIFAGNDLRADTLEGKYSYPVQDFDLKKKHNFSKTLDQVSLALKGWYPIAKRRGFRWFSWECGPIFESMVEKFNPSMLENLRNESLPPPKETYKPTVTSVQTAYRDLTPKPKAEPQDIVEIPPMSEEQKTKAKYLGISNKALVKLRHGQRNNRNV